MKKLLLVFAMMPFLFTSCVGKKKLADMESQLTQLQASSSSALSKAKADLSDCQSLTASLQGELKKKRYRFRSEEWSIESFTRAIRLFQEDKY